MELIAINTTLSKHSKKEFLVDKLVREYCEFSFEDLLNELYLIRHELHDKELYSEMVQFIRQFIAKAKYLLYKYCETLVMVLGECLNFYIRRRKVSEEECEYSLVIGLDRVCVSFCSSNEYCENIIHGLVTKLRERCMADGHDIVEHDFDITKIVASDSNSMELDELPSHFLELYSKK